MGCIRFPVCFRRTLWRDNHARLNNGGLVAGLIPTGSMVYLWTQNDKPVKNGKRLFVANTNAL